MANCLLASQIVDCNLLSTKASTNIFYYKGFIERYFKARTHFPSNSLQVFRISQLQRQFKLKLKTARRAMLRKMHCKMSVIFTAFCVCSVDEFCLVKHAGKIEKVTENKSSDRI